MKTEKKIHPAMTKYHEARWEPRLQELARRCGIELRPLKHYVDGTVLLAVKHPDAEYDYCGSCGEYGKAFSDALAGVRWRCGDAVYGYNTFPLWEKNGWAYVSSADIVHALDRAGIQES